MPEVGEVRVVLSPSCQEYLLLVTRVGVKDHQSTYGRAIVSARALKTGSGRSCPLKLLIYSPISFGLNFFVKTTSKFNVREWNCINF